MPAISKRRYPVGCVSLAKLLGLAALLAFQFVGSAVAIDMPVTVKPIAILSVDDDGRGLSYPSTVFFDPAEDEIYLINGGTSRVIVYGPDFFPRYSIGKGRGVAYPRGIHVTDKGEVYVAQAVNRANPVRRITILNGAFFVDREVFFDEIPEAAGFSPRQLAVGRDGTIYATSDRHRGVLVLDREGNYLRWLKPLDLISDRKAIAETKRELEEAERQRKAEAPPGEDVAGSEAADSSTADIPEEYRPGGGDGEGGGDTGKALGAVRVSHVSIDSAGHLYLLSTETSKTYVYSADESFLFSFGEKGGTPRKLSQPKSLAIDEPRGLIYIVDYSRHSVLVYNLSGEYIFEFGGRGFKPGFFNFPISIAVNRRGEVIVADLFNKRVQVLDVKYDQNLYQPVETPAPAEAGAEGAAETTGEAGEGVAPAGEADSEAVPADAASPAPDAAVEEVIIPAGELPAQPEAGSGQEAAPATSVDLPPPPEKPQAGTAGQKEEVIYPVEPPSVIELQAPREPSSGVPATGVEGPAVPATGQEQPDAVIEEQVIPEQKLPAYPAEKQD